MQTHMSIETEVELLEELSGCFWGVESERLRELMNLLFDVEYPHIDRYTALCYYAATMRLAQIDSGQEHPARPLEVGVPGAVRVQVPPPSRCKTAQSAA